jgi:hypothetical protein
VSSTEPSRSASAPASAGRGRARREPAYGEGPWQEMRYRFAPDPALDAWIARHQVEAGLVTAGELGAEPEQDRADELEAWPAALYPVGHPKYPRGGRA